MNREQIIERLKAAEPRLRGHGIAALYLFGSYARGDARDDSDIDVFVDKAPDRKFGLHDFMAAFRALQDAIPDAEIGYTTREGIVASFRPYIERDAIRVF